MKNTIIEALNWRYAVKKYDASKKISDSDLEVLKESIRLAPTAFGLQSFSVLIIENPEIRAQLQVASYGQTQVVDASHLFVFAAHKSVSDVAVDSYMTNVANTRKLQIEQTHGFGNHIKQSVSPMNADEISDWNTKQTYLALGQLLQTAAEMRIDSTPMEGFDAERVNEILNLDALDMKVSVICALGYRSTDDKNQFQAKVRKHADDLFQII
ncbi:MAG: NAD(P)H-dependent oxidoreductase [Bacteroidota bacterium]